MCECPNESFVDGGHDYQRIGGIDLSKDDVIDIIEEETYTDKELLNRAIQMLAEWCNAVDKRGTSYDDWDYYYKTAMYNQHPLRQLIDDKINSINNK